MYVRDAEMLLWLTLLAFPQIIFKFKCLYLVKKSLNFISASHYIFQKSLSDSWLARLKNQNSLKFTYVELTILGQVLI